MNLEETLERLEQYCSGVTLTMSSTLGWRCYGELRVRVTGGKFEIKSEVKHPAPLPAAQQMLERVEACLADIHKAAAATPLNHQAPELEHRR